MYVNSLFFSGFTHVPFPAHYPKGVLLGCVDVIDMISQEELKRRQALVKKERGDGEGEGEEEENGSEYMFVCVNPRRLVMPFPVKGDHKICTYLLYVSLF